MAHFIRVIFQYRSGHKVEVVPYLATWRQAQRPCNPQQCGPARRRVLTHQVLPALQEKYPEQTWSFLSWEDFLTTPSEPTTAPPRHHAPAVSTPADINAGYEENFECHCLDDQGRCPVRAPDTR